MNKKGDIMIEEIKNMMNNATDSQKLEIAQLHKNLTDGIVANTFVYDSREKITESIIKRLQKYTPFIIKVDIRCNDAPYILYDDNNELRAHSWSNFVKILTEYIFTFYSTETIKEEYYDNIKTIINKEKEECINLLDELNKRKLTQRDVDILCKDFCCGDELFNDQLFKFIPKYIEKFDDLVEVLDKYNYENEDKIISALHFMNRNKDNFDDERKIFKGEYWFYIDGVNWESWAVYQYEIINLLKWEVEEDMTKEEQKDYLEVLKAIL